MQQKRFPIIAGFARYDGIFAGNSFLRGYELLPITIAILPNKEKMN